MSCFQNLGQLICRDRDLSKIAIIDLDGKGQAREISYAALDTMANGAARAIAQRGFERGDRVAILSANRAGYLAAYFAIMRAGLVAVPVNYRFPPKMIDFVIHDAGAKLVFCDCKRRANSPPDVPTICFADVGVDGFDQFLNHGSFTEIIPTANEPAMYLYTSGSTGVPKGVVLSHQNHIWVVETRLAGRDLSRQRYLIAAPLYRGDRSISLHLPDRRTANDRHDVARSRAVSLDRSVQRRICPYGLGTGQPKLDVVAETSPAASCHHKYVRYDGRGPRGIWTPSRRPAGTGYVCRLSPSKSPGSASGRR